MYGSEYVGYVMYVTSNNWEVSCQHLRCLKTWKTSKTSKTLKTLKKKKKKKKKKKNFR